MCKHSRDWVCAPVVRQCLCCIRWLSGTHTHIHTQTHTFLSAFRGIKIGVKRDSLICSLGRSPAGGGLYGLTGRRRGRAVEEKNGEIEPAEKRERETFLFWEVKRDRKGSYIVSHSSALRPSAPRPHSPPTLLGHVPC